MTLDLFKQLSQEVGDAEIAVRLGLHKNTITRWHETGRVPNHYQNDFKRMSGDNGDAEDQFFTKPHIAEKCYKTAIEVLTELGIAVENYYYVEPSAGSGFFYDLLPKNQRIGMDIDPLEKGIIKQDYLLWKPIKNGKRYIVIGNPPFGLRGHLALQFLNHSATYADAVAFILPQLFESDGKGVPAKRVDDRLQLAYSQPLPNNSFVKPEGTEINISTIFQVWTAINKDKIRLKKRKTAKKFIKVYSLSNGGTPSSTRNKKMIGKCDIYLPSTCFKGMQSYSSFEELPNKRGYGIVIHRSKEQIYDIIKSHDWTKTAFPSTNGAMNLRTSLIEDVITAKGFYDE